MNTIFASMQTYVTLFCIINTIWIKCDKMLWNRFDQISFEVIRVPKNSRTSNTISSSIWNGLRQLLPILVLVLVIKCVLVSVYIDINVRESACTTLNLHWWQLTPSVVCSTHAYDSLYQYRNACTTPNYAFATAALMTANIISGVQNTQTYKPIQTIFQTHIFACEYQLCSISLSHTISSEIEFEIFFQHTTQKSS